MAKRGTLDHPKTRRLARAIGLPRFAALGLMEAVWQWVSRYTPTGFLTEEDILDCADTVGFDGDLSSVWVKAGLLDEVEGGFYIHDWHEHADDATKKALEKAGKSFANGSRLRRMPQEQPEKPEIEPSTSDEQPIREQFANNSRTKRDSLAKPSQAMPSHTKPVEGEGCGERDGMADDPAPPPREQGSPKNPSASGSDSRRFDPRLALNADQQSRYGPEWLDWCKHRSEKRKTLTARAVDLQLADLDKMDDPGGAIRHSIKQGYIGIYEPKKKVEPAYTPSRFTGMSAEEIARQLESQGGAA